MNVAHHTKDNFPAYLGDYGEFYVSPRAARPATPDTFSGWYRRGPQKVGGNRNAEPYNLAVSGILVSYAAHQPGPSGRCVPSTKTALHQAHAKWVS